MNPMVNLNTVIEKELEQERQGFRRTRRWIGDANQATDNRWFRAELRPASQVSSAQAAPRQVSQPQPRWRAYSAFLTRMLSLTAAPSRLVDSRG